MEKCIGPNLKNPRRLGKQIQAERNKSDKIGQKIGFAEMADPRAEISFPVGTIHFGCCQPASDHWGLLTAS